MLEKFLIIGYSSCPFLLNILSKFIWYLYTTYIASLRSFASSSTYGDLIGLISSLLDWVFYQCCCNYTMLQPHFCKFLFLLALKWISNYKEFEWFHKTLNSVYWEIFVMFHCPSASAAIGQTCSFWSSLLLITQIFLPLTASQKVEKKSPNLNWYKIKCCLLQLQIWNTGTWHLVFSVVVISRISTLNWLSAYNTPHLSTSAIWGETELGQPFKKSHYPVHLSVLYIKRLFATEV